MKQRVVNVIFSMDGDDFVVTEPFTGLTGRGTDRREASRQLTQELNAYLASHPYTLDTLTEIRQSHGSVIVTI